MQYIPSRREVVFGGLASAIVYILGGCRKPANDTGNNPSSALHSSSGNQRAIPSLIEPQSQTHDYSIEGQLENEIRRNYNIARTLTSQSQTKKNPVLYDRAMEHWQRVISLTENGNGGKYQSLRDDALLERAKYAQHQGRLNVAIDDYVTILHEGDDKVMDAIDALVSLRKKSSAVSYMCKHSRSEVLVDKLLEYAVGIYFGSMQSYMGMLQTPPEERDGVVPRIIAPVKTFELLDNLGDVVTDKAVNKAVENYFKSEETNPPFIKDTIKAELKKAKGTRRKILSAALN